MRHSLQKAELESSNGPLATPRIPVCAKVQVLGQRLIMINMHTCSK